MLRKAENGRAMGLSVAADAFEDAGAVVDDVAHDVNIGVLPGNQVAVVPDFRGRLNRHEGLNCSFDRARDGYNSGYRESRQRVTAGIGLARQSHEWLDTIGAFGRLGFAGSQKLLHSSCKTADLRPAPWRKLFVSVGAFGFLWRNVIVFSCVGQKGGGVGYLAPWYKPGTYLTIRRDFGCSGDHQSIVRVSVGLDCKPREDIWHLFCQQVSSRDCLIALAWRGAFCIFSDLQFPKMSESAGIDRGNGVLVIV